MKESVATLEELSLRAPFKWVLGLHQLFKRNNVHRFDISDRNSYFFLDKNPDCPEEFYMTAHKGSVEVKDLIKIEHNSETVTYIIEEISFYSNPSDLWVARLSSFWSNSSNK